MVDIVNQQREQKEYSVNEDETSTAAPARQRLELSEQRDRLVRSVQEFVPTQFECASVIAMSLLPAGLVIRSSHSENPEDRSSIQGDQPIHPRHWQPD